MNRIRLLSDLHVEFRRGYTFPKSLLETHPDDVLVLAGDIHIGAKRVLDVIDQFKDAGARQIVYVTGNHEYYNGYYADFDTDWYSDPRSNAVHRLDNSFVKIGDTTFIGATLWTNFRNDHWLKIACNRQIADFNVIKDFTTAHAVDLFDQSLAFIKKAYELNAGKKVIVTHFLPAVDCIHPRFRTQSNINGYFANDLGAWIETLKDTTWLFGHTHDSVDVTIGETRCIANPYGYTPNGINPNFRENYEIN